jgi:hypothetical protein
MEAGSEDPKILAGAFTVLWELHQKEVHRIAKEKGWWDQQTPREWFIKKHKEDLDFTARTMMEAYSEGQKNPPRNEGEMIVLMHSELSEAIEGLRKKLDSDHIPGFLMIEEEFADVIIRIMDQAEFKKYRVIQAIIAKMKFNEGREYKHGGKNF